MVGYHKGIMQRIQSIKSVFSNKYTVKYTVYRWLDIVVLIITSCLICLPLYSFLNIDWPAFINIGNDYVGFIFSFLCMGLIWFAMIRLGGFRLKPLLSKADCYYPPIWPFAILGAILFIWIASLPCISKTNQIDMSWSLLLYCIVVFVVAAIFAGVWDCLYRKIGSSNSAVNKVKNEEIKKEKRIIWEDSAWNEWIKREEPITNPDEDLFDLLVFADRIYEILKTRSVKTISLVGPYGCGKSSILKMVESIDEKNGSANIIICWVDGWGYRGNSVLEHILASAIKELSNYIDCMGLMRIPSSYVNAFNIDSIWKILPFMAAVSHQEPIYSLSKLDNALACIGKQMVVFIEDMDRNENKDLYTNLVALLDRLKKLKNVSFVLAIGNAQPSAEFLFRIAEHQENVPSVLRQDIVDLVQVFRGFRLDELKKEMYCLITEERKEWDDIIDNIAGVLNNPRTAKTALRRTLQAWQSLKGEIDLDDLIIANIIRTVSPMTYSIINENMPDMRNVRLKAAPFQEKLFASIPEELNRKAMESLLTSWLFPDPSSALPLQGIHHPHPHPPIGSSPNFDTDYWSRLNREKVPPDEIKDQDIIRAVKHWKENKEAKVFKNCSLPEAIRPNKELADKIAQFHSLFNAEEARELMSGLLAQIRETGFPDRDMHNDHCYNALNFNVVWKKYDEQNETWFLEEINKALQENLAVACSIYSLSRANEGEGEFPYGKKRLQDEVVGRARKLYENNPDIIITALKNNNMLSICRLLHGRKSGLNPSDWKCLTDTLLLAAEKNPQIIIPQLAAFVVEEKNGDNDFKKDVESTLWQKFFDTESWPKLMSLVATPIDTSSLFPEDLEDILSARDIAQKHLNAWESSH